LGLCIFLAVVFVVLFFEKFRSKERSKVGKNYELFSVLKNGNYV